MQLSQPLRVDSVHAPGCAAASFPLDGQPCCVPSVPFGTYRHPVLGHVLSSRVPPSLLAEYGWHEDSRGILRFEHVGPGKARRLTGVTTPSQSGVSQQTFVREAVKPYQFWRNPVTGLCTYSPSSEVPVHLRLHLPVVVKECTLRAARKRELALVAKAALGGAGIVKKKSKTAAKAVPHSSFAFDSYALPSDCDFE